MKTLLRGSRILILLALFLTTITIFAQESTEEAAPEATAEVTDAVPTAAPEATPEATAEAVAFDGTVDVVGSGVVNPLLQSLLDASGSTQTFEIQTTGTDAGFEAFCQGNADIVTSYRAITLEEDTACREASVNYFELLVAYDALAFIANPADETISCLSAENIAQLYAPSSTGSVTSWNQLTFPGDTGEEPAAVEVTPEATAESTAEAEESLPIALYVPLETSTLYFSLDAVVPGVGFRSDLTSTEESSVVENVSSTPGALGVVSLQSADAAGESVRLVPITFSGNPEGCIEPSVENIENEVYPASSLFLYVNRDIQPEISDFLDFITGDASMEAVQNAGFTALSEATYETNRAVVSGEEENPFSAVEATYDISPTLAGNISVVGDPSVYRFVESATQRLTANREGFAVNNNLAGTTAGTTAFCNGEAQILFVNGDGTLNADQQAICNENNINSYNVSIGYQAVVLLSNAGDSYTSCLTTDQLATIWGASSTDTITNWNQVSEAMPDQAMTLFGIPEGSTLADILLTPPSGGIPVPVRVDTEQDADALYRAAATANVPGAITYMNWVDYARVLENEQANVQLVAVDAGAGCVVPSLETIQSGEYQLARQTTMLVNYAALATPETQAFVWTMFEDANYSTIDNLGFTALDENDLNNFQEELLAEFDLALEALLAQPEVTPEVTAESTSEATAEATEAQ